MSDRVELLIDRNINVVSPTFAGKGVTPSSMSSAVASAFDGDWDTPRLFHTDGSVAQW